MTLPRHVAITGGSGLLASLLIPTLTAGGVRVTRLVRRPAAAGEISWDPARGVLAPGDLTGIDALIHLAGENLADRRWTPARKRALRTSRVDGTRLVAEAVARAPEGPRTLVSASAIGYYGDLGEATATEASPPGHGFLPELAAAWEAAAVPAEAAGIRVVRIRIGLVLTPRGGLLQRMLLPFRLGVGGRLGTGRQWMSWISADDLVSVFHFVLGRAGLRGPVNAVAPAPVRNSEMTRAVAGALHRPAVLPVPRLALRALFGEMADEAILASTRVEPAVLQAQGFRWRHPDLASALAALLPR